MINRVNLYLFCLAIVCTGGCLNAAESAHKVLRILNWSEYISVDPNIDDGLSIEDRSYALKEFSEEFGCEVEYYEYEETTEAMARLNKSEGFYDVIIASTGEVERMLEGGYIEKLDRRLIPNHRYISLFYDELESKRDVWNFAMPYLYGTTGIAYRTDLCDFEVTRFSQFFDPEFAQGVKRAIMNDCQVMLGLTNLYLGNDPNENRRSNHNEAIKALRRLKTAGLVDSISTNVELLGEKLTSGEIGFAVMYSGDALAIARNHKNLKYVIPEEGAEYYIDSFVIPNSTTKKELAHAFVNFMLRPEVNARESMNLLFPTFNLAALSIVEKKAPEQLQNESIYPLPETLGNLHEFSMHSASQLQYWSRFLNED